MKKKVAKRARTKKVRSLKVSFLPRYLAVIRGWMFVVVFALMLGIGAIIGSALNSYLSTGQVAGVQIEQPLK